jgi:beta-xylosidase
MTLKVRTVCFAACFALAIFLTTLAVSAQEKKTSGNPLFPGWYADPEVICYGDTYWIYPTYSAPYEQQIFFDCFSSKDLVNWTKHEKILTNNEVKWAKRAMWAPSVLQKGDKYYFFFGANDVHEGEIGGIGEARAVIQRSCALESYEPQHTQAWQDAYGRLLDYRKESVR